MQRIERYGVLALVFLLVTIITFALWDDGAKGRPEEVAAAAPQDRAADAGRSERDAARRRQIELAEQRRREAEAVQQRLADQRRRAEQRGPDDDLVSRFANASELGELSKDTRGGQLEELPEAKVDGSRRTTPSLQVGERSGRSEPTASAPERPAPNRRRPAGDRDREISPVRAKDALLRSTEYEIVSGDTLGEIAQEHLGSSSRWREIAAANPGIDANRLTVGETITIPARGASDPSTASTASSSAAAAPEPTPSAPTGDGVRYTVRSGDLLSVIAQERLGSVSDMPRILALNPGLDPDRLHAGQVILLPEGASSARSSAVASAPRRSSSASRSDDRPRVR